MINYGLQGYKGPIKAINGQKGCKRPIITGRVRFDLFIYIKLCKKVKMANRGKKGHKRPKRL